MEKYVDFIKSPSANERNLFIMSSRSEMNNFTQSRHLHESPAENDSDLNFI